MANLLTHSISWGGKENMEYILAPLFIGQHPLEMGFRTIPNVQSTMKLNYFSAITKVLKAYAKGFSPPSGKSTFTQRSLTVTELKAEYAEDAYDFRQTVFEQALNKGIDWNKISGTVLGEIIMKLFTDGVKSDTFRKFWLADTTKETVASAKYTGTADPDYNEFNGIWKLIFDAVAATTITRNTIANAAVAQEDKVTLTGTSGTANITVNGVAYLATFASSLTQTATNFVTTHAAALALRHITVTSSTDEIHFTSAIPGMAFDCSNAINASGDLAGTRAAVTANTLPSALATDEAVGEFRKLVEGSPKVLKQIPANMKRLYVTDTMLENYQETLESDGTEQAHRKLVEGQERLVYRGTPLIPVGWDGDLLADFPNAMPHRAVLSVPQNIIVGIDNKSEFNKSEFWYNQDEQENRFRIQFKFGCNYALDDLIIVAY